MVALVALHKCQFHWLCDQIEQHVLSNKFFHVHCINSVSICAAFDHLGRGELYGYMRIYAHTGTYHVK